MLACACVSKRKRVYVRFVRAQGQRFGGQGEHGGGQRFFWGAGEQFVPRFRRGKLKRFTGR